MKSNIKKNFLAFLGIMLFSAGLCFFGEAVMYKYESKDWFFIGTISLVLINSGLVLIISNK
ncbi:MAG: hypothetical protein CBD72_05350 [Flavobacteriaceae bacterium TMED212]|jgi:hypothetical protein|nr:MAG: hypothetical protein CBD72_05350 [Flavobacteriaceae bacterium TMED212]|tara:strand:+ start:862 stop:1044 length:183 start_codon:yes stop_codon:yes gene_type:complete